MEEVCNILCLWVKSIVILGPGLLKFSYFVQSKCLQSILSKDANEEMIL